jgi:hypothetical protein
MRKPADWIRRRVGSSGPASLFVQRELLTLIGKELSNTPNISRYASHLGLSKDELSHLALESRFDLLASHFPTRGNTEGLKRIAWYGSALADIACGDYNEEVRTWTLKDAALFNVAAALFDTVMDDIPRRAHLLQEALHPSVLSTQLARGNQDNVHLANADLTLRPLIILFDTLLANLNRRYAHNTRMLDDLGRLLKEMYESEVGSTSDRTLAKTLPIIFIGRIADCPNARLDLRLFEHLAQFISLLDDSRDLAQDLVCLSANFFLSRRCDFPGVLEYSRNILYRLLGGQASHSDIASILCLSLKRVINTALSANAPVPQKTLVFLNCLLGGQCHQLQDSYVRY